MATTCDSHRAGARPAVVSGACAASDGSSSSTHCHRARPVRAAPFATACQRSTIPRCGSSDVTAVTSRGYATHGGLATAVATRVVAASASASSASSGDAGTSSTPRFAYWPRVRHFVAGYFSGCALVLAGHPFDTIKVRVQTAPSGQFKGPLHCLTSTVRREGLAAVYKGVTPPLLATGVINSILFGMQGWFVHTIVSRRAALEAGVDPSEADSPAPYVTEIMMAAVLSGAAISVFVAPMEGVKARLQVQYAAKGQQAAYAGPIDCVRKLLRDPNLGLTRGLYRGWLPTALCRMSNWSYFGSYEFLRRIITPTDADGKPQKPPLLASVMAGGLTGFCYWMSCYPIDVIKNRIQAAPDVWPPTYQGLRGAARAINAEAGWRGFYKGFAPCVLRAFPANAACFLAYEVALKVLPEKW